MRIYIFKSDANDLQAFAGDINGSRLPEKFKPWVQDGFIETGAPPPHSLSRFKIESAIKLHGFQLWRVKEKAE